MPNTTNDINESRQPDQADAQVKVAPQADARMQPAPQAGDPVQPAHEPRGAKAKASKAGATAAEMPDPSPAAFGLDATSLPFDTLLPLQRAQAEAVVKANQALMNGVAAINREVTDYASQRARAIVDGAKAAPRDGNWQDLWSFQIDYTRCATEAYCQEASKLVDLGMSVSRETWAPLQECVMAAFAGMQRQGR